MKNKPYGQRPTKREKSNQRNWRLLYQPLEKRVEDFEKKNPAINLLREKLGLNFDSATDTETGEYINNEDFLKHLNKKPK